jgi:putative membrane protein
MLSTIIILLIALLHIYFLILEMFLWEKPLGLKTFRNTPEKAAITKVLAANQGLYNGFLAAGLLWGLYLQSSPVLTFFLVCISIAGIYGALTAARKILYIQGLPAIIALIVLHFL